MSSNQPQKKSTPAPLPKIKDVYDSGAIRKLKLSESDLSDALSTLEHLVRKEVQDDKNVSDTTKRSWNKKLAKLKSVDTKTIQGAADIILADNEFDVFLNEKRINKEENDLAKQKEKLDESMEKLAKLVKEVQDKKDSVYTTEYSIKQERKKLGELHERKEKKFKEILQAIGVSSK